MVVLLGEVVAGGVVAAGVVASRVVDSGLQMGSAVTEAERDIKYSYMKKVKSDADIVQSPHWSQQSLILPRASSQL